jgi:FkbM family methyltransferase
MVKMILYYINRVLEKISYFFSSEGKELRRIKKIPRYQIATTQIFGFEFTFVDSASFIGQYDEIFKKQSYKFNTTNNQPFIIDCGSNVGVSLLYYLREFPNAKIVAFEPDKNVFAILKSNVEKMNSTNITLVNKGVWNADGVISFLQEGADGGQVLDNNTNVSAGAKTIEIETTSLKKYLSSKIDFLKIDIEGAEVEVIEDCENLLQNAQQVFIEFHSTVGKVQKLDTILKILSKNNFRYFVESVTLFNNQPFIKRTVINSFDNLLSIYAYKIVA